MVRGLLGIEIADRTLRYVFLEKDSNVYRIMKAGKSTADVDLSAPGSLFQAIQSVLETEQISPDRIFLTVSRRDTVIHQVTLPKMSSRELEEVVSGEIEKIPVFFSRNFDYIFRSYPDDKDKVRVLFAAMGRNILDTMIKEVQKTERPCRDLEIFPLNLKDILPLVGAGRGCEALCIVHDHLTYINIIEDGEYRHFYQSSKGLQQLQSAISDISRESILSNLTSEIKRVLQSYASQGAHPKVERIWLVWDQETEPALEERISKDTCLPVDALDLNRLEKIVASQGFQANPVYLPALTPIVFHVYNRKPTFPLNHFFRHLQLKSYIAKAVVMTAAVVAGAGVALAGVLGYFQTQTSALSQELASINQEIVEQKKEADFLLKRHEQYVEIRERLLRQASYVNELNRVSWSQVLAVFSKELPEELALSEFKFTENGSASIQGEAFQMESIAELIRRVDGSAILQAGKFDFLKEKKIDEYRLYNFGILAKLKDPEEDKPAETVTPAENVNPVEGTLQ